ncbi:MAG: GntR family transcriptional regulator [Planctomycetia bacterium]|nr:GntR family transcriptional regulator [Planctomycetia bacterium]
MQKKLVNVERTLCLADRLLQDILQRKLKPGDTYFTTIEAAAFLGVAGASANRALQFLEKRKVLARSQKRGAVILDPSNQSPTIDHVHFIFNDKFSSMGTFGEEIVNGVRQELPLSHLSYVSLDNTRTQADTVADLLDKTAQNGLTHGFIMISSSAKVQKLISQSGNPCVILGTKCPGVPAINQMDVDHEMTLRLLVEYLRQRGRKRIAVVLRRMILPGDITLINTAIRLGIPNCFFLQHAEEDEDVIDELCELMKEQFLPDGVVCLSANHTVAFAQALEKMGKSQDCVELTAMFYHRRDPLPIVTHVVPEPTVAMIGRRLAQRLLDSAIGLQPRAEVIPVKIVLRDDSAPLPKDSERLPSSEYCMPFPV